MGNISNNGLSQNFLDTAKHFSNKGVDLRSLERIIEVAMDDGKISDAEYNVLSQLHDSDF